MLAFLSLDASSKSLPVKYVPAWFLGANFQREAREWRKYAQAMLERPTEAVKKAMNEGTARPSMMLSLLGGLSGNEDPHVEWIISSAAATAYEGGLQYSRLSRNYLTFLQAGQRRSVAICRAAYARLILVLDLLGSL